MGFKVCSAAHVAERVDIACGLHADRLRAADAAVEVS